MTYSELGPNEAPDNPEFSTPGGDVPSDPAMPETPTAQAQGPGVGKKRGSAHRSPVYAEFEALDLDTAEKEFEGDDAESRTALTAPPIICF